jgi:uncharacterized integral membrane protein
MASERPTSAAPGTTPSGKTKARDRKELGKLLAALVLGGLLATFAVLNLDKVKVDWIFGSFRTPLILVIAVSVVAGMVLDRLIATTRRRRKRTPKA